MTKRFFKATDGQITVFRASATKVYVCATKDGIYDMQFSTVARWGWMPCEEITKAEYDALQARKVERVRSSGHPIAWASRPYQSWVRNAALEG